MSTTGGALHVGSPPADFQLEHVQLVHFHDFFNLPVTENTPVKSPIFWCAGHKWLLLVFPGGRKGAEDGYASVSLVNRLNRSPSKITAHWEIHVKAPNILNNKSNKKRDIFKGKQGRLCKGTLTFELRIRPDPEYYCNTVKIDKSLSENMLALFRRENNMDVAFEVKGDFISAHRAFLRAQDPDLAELCETYDMTNPMPIDDVEPGIFKLMLEYLHGNNIIDIDEWKAQSSYLVDPDKHSQSILRAAGKYGFTTLKSEAEAWYLKFHKLEVDNVIDNLLYADGHHLLVLKEATLKFIVENSESVVASESYTHLDESPHLRREVVLALSKQLSLKRE